MSTQPTDDTAGQAPALDNSQPAAGEASAAPARLVFEQGEYQLVFLHAGRESSSIGLKTLVPFDQIVLRREVTKTP